MALPALLAAAAPHVISALTSALMTYGLSSMGGSSGGTLENAPVSGSELKSELQKLIAEGKSEEEASRQLVSKYASRMKAQGGSYKPFFVDPKYGLGGSRLKQVGSAMKSAGRYGGQHLAGALIGIPSFLAIDALLGAMHGGGTEQPVGQMPMGTGQEELMAMLQGSMENRPTTSALRENLSTMKSLVEGQQRMAGLGYTPSGVGVRPDLDALIAGKERELASMAYREPMSIAQALAARGLWRPSNNPGIQDIM